MKACFSLLPQFCLELNISESDDGDEEESTMSRPSSPKEDQDKVTDLTPIMSATKRESKRESILTSQSESKTGGSAYQLGK